MDNKEEKVLERDTKPLPDLSKILTEEQQTAAEPTMEDFFEMEGMQQAPESAQEPEEEVISKADEPVNGDTVRLDTLAVIEAVGEAPEEIDDLSRWGVAVVASGAKNAQFTFGSNGGKKVNNNPQPDTWRKVASVPAPVPQALHFGSDFPAEWEYMLNDLVGLWSSKLWRNRVRMRYYNGKNVLKDFGISIPPQLLNVETIVGWPQKAVDALAVRSRFDGFTAEEDGWKHIAHYPVVGGEYDGSGY